MKPIFNSLGSNYDFRYVVTALATLITPVDKYTSILTSKLSQLFEGEVTLTYKGRDAIELALKKLGVTKGDQVLTQAFTCHAIEEAIVRTGAKPVFVDLESGVETIRELFLQPSIKTLEESINHSQHPKALIIQNTLGFSADIKNIALWCKKNNLYLIEDLAQSFGATDIDGNKLGKYADAIILSFGRDKIIDAISGGACIVKNSFNSNIMHKQSSNSVSVEYNSVSFLIIIRDMLYPLFTWIIRKTHNILIGKIIQRILVNTKLISNPIQSPTNSIKLLTGHYAKLALIQLNKLDKQLDHRRKIAKIYQKKIKSTSLKVAPQEISHATNLRYPLFIDHPNKLISFLKNHNIHIADRWYRKPVDFGKLNKKTSYREGQCPNAEEFSKHIINLPTHQEITEEDVLRISKLVNNFSKMQSDI